MRILLLTYGCSPNSGGEEKVGWQWAIQLALQGQEVVVITKTEPGKKEKINSYIKQKKITNLHVEYIDMNKNKLFSIVNKKFGTMTMRIIVYQFFLYRKVKKMIENQHFDILHQVTPVNFRVPFLSSKVKHIPTIFGPVGGGQILRKWMYEYVDEKPIQKYRRLLNKIIIKLPIIRKNLEQASKIFVGNHATKNLINKSINHSTIYLPDIGVLKSEIACNKQKNINENETIKLLWAGRMIPLKGLSLLIETLAKINDTSDFKLIVAGGEEKDILTYSDMVKRLQVSNIQFLGKVPHEEMKKVYTDADVFIFTSMIDTGGSVLLEAASAGLPIILSDINGKDIFGNDGALYLDYSSKKSAEDSIKEALEQISEIGLREMLSAKSIRIAEKNSWEEKARFMIEVYESLIEKQQQ